MASLFKVLGNEKRRQILSIIKKRPLHISAIAKQIGLSKPVTLKHIKKLEAAGLIYREKIGTIHIIKINREFIKKLDTFWDIIDNSLEFEIKKNTPLSEVLQKIDAIIIKKTKKGCLIHSIDGKKGYFVYETEGKIPRKPIDKYKIKKDTEIEIKRLLPALDKKIKIKIVDKK